MKRILMVLAMSVYLASCVTGGYKANNGAALTSTQSVFVGDWNGKTESGKPVRIVVTDKGGVSYYFQGVSQTLGSVKITDSSLSFKVGDNGSTVVFAASGAYTFTWRPTGQLTRAMLTKA